MRFNITAKLTLELSFGVLLGSRTVAAFLGGPGTIITRTGVEAPAPVASTTDDPLSATPDDVEETSSEDAGTDNVLGTTLYFTKTGDCSTVQKAQIKQAYKDFHSIASIGGVASNINWNEAATLEFLGPADYNANEQAQIQAVFANMATVGDGYLPLLHHWIYARCDDIAGRCPASSCTNQLTDTAANLDLIAYSFNTAPDANYPMINFCPDFFKKSSLADAMTYGKSQDLVGQNTLENYDNQAQTMFHEILHLHLGADSLNGSPNPEVEDLKMWVGDSNQPLRYAETMIYGVPRCKVLARYVKEVDSQQETGYWIQRNADSLAWYAMAKYVENDRGSYPYLPIITTEVISGSPYDPTVLMTLDPTNPVLSILNNGFNGFDPVPGCSDNLDPAMELAASVGETTFRFLTKVSLDTDFPADYQAMKAGWISNTELVLGLGIGKRGSQEVSGKVERKWNA